MLQKIICLLAVTSFVPFTGYSDEVVNAEKAMIPQQTEVLAEGQLAGCGCGKKNKGGNLSDDDQFACSGCKDNSRDATNGLPEEGLLAGCGCGKKKKDGHEAEEAIVDEEEEADLLAKCPGNCVPPKVAEEDEEEVLLARCPKCVPPNKQNDDDEDEQLDEEEKKIA